SRDWSSDVRSSDLGASLRRPSGTRPDSGSHPIVNVTRAVATSRYMSSLAEPRLDLDLFRRSTDRVVAGVAGGVADRLGVQAGYVRAAFAAATFLWGLGIVVYVALWMATFERVEDRPRRLVSTRQQAGLGLVFIGSLLAFRFFGWWPGDLVMVIVTALAFGMAVLSDFDWLARILDPEAVRPSKQRVVVGTLLLLVGL